MADTEQLTAYLKEYPGYGPMGCRRATRARAAPRDSQAMEHDARVAELQAAYYAEDIVPPSESVGWDDSALEAFFAAGGLSAGQRPTCQRLRAALRAASDVWPTGESRLPPTSHVDALDERGPWSAVACGVAIRQCDEQPIKGHGAFAIRQIEADAPCACVRRRWWW